VAEIAIVDRQSSGAVHRQRPWLIVMGDILFIAHRIPYPPDRGDKIRSWHMLKALTQHASVHVAALVDEERDWRYSDVLEGVADTVILEPRNLSKARAALSGLVTGQSASVRAFANSALRRRITHLLATRPIKSIFVYSGQMAQYVPKNLGGRRFVMDFVDMDSAKFKSYADQSSGLSAFAMRQEAARLFKFERETAARADKCLFVSEAEAQLFRDHTGLGRDKVDMIENGIDLDRFDPAIGFDPVVEKTGPLAVFTGQMDYRPNIEAVSAFARETLPLIRTKRSDAQFAIVGRAPTDEVKALAALPGVIVTGEVADTRDWLAAADAVVAPLKLARGIQNKVLEAMAMARPVIVSPAAAEGIDAAEFVVASTPQEEADAVLALLADPARAHALGEASRARMVARYSWDARLSGLPAILGLPK
jgi:polysaccharide biosynthesis protein PslH